MSFKQNIIDSLTMNIYHDLKHITIIHEVKKVTKTYKEIVTLLNEAKLSQNDVMNLLKHVTLNVISQCNQHYINDQEKINKKQFQADFR